MNGRVLIEMSNGMTLVYPLRVAGGATTIVPVDDGSLRIELVSAASSHGESNVLICYFNPGTWNCAYIFMEVNQ